MSIARLLPLVALLLCWAAPARGALITVTSNLDDGVGCTLRAALDAANTDASADCTPGSGADVIELDASGTDYGVLLGLSVTSDVTIRPAAGKDATIERLARRRSRSSVWRAAPSGSSR